MTRLACEINIGLAPPSKNLKVEFKKKVPLSIYLFFLWFIGFLLTKKTYNFILAIPQYAAHSKSQAVFCLFYHIILEDLL